jgi:hypothetical protein
MAEYFSEFPNNASLNLNLENLPTLNSLPDLPKSLTFLRIVHGLGLIHIPELPTSLLTLTIEHCPSLTRLPDLTGLTGIQSLRLVDCPRLVVRWSTLAALPRTLNNLEIYNCDITMYR